ncbi:MAG: DUF3107 domain-containing protein [Actinobacteria bacterium]|nr:DUF3107 domain-containing protein [Actinomycetota bacterium]
MDVRLGVTYTSKELVVDVGDDMDSAGLRKAVESAMAEPGGMFWLTDRRGRQVGVPVERLSYVEIGSPDTGPRVGFGS